ncbi:lipoyl synthase [Candidatus Poriferisocius sp.]|uniref:lipoyl synthase n=1 Tax=Candidatus Poriferisocius sp. TaxID=3101276 RepID=UPI003B0132CA
MSLRVRWLGRVPYRDAHACQEAMFERSGNYLLLLEHPHVFTLGLRGDEANILVDPAEVGAEVVYTNRGGDVTYHGPGQLVGYSVMTVPGKRGGGMADTVAYVRSVEQLVIDALGDLGLPGCGRLSDYPGVWVDPDGENPRKIAAIGVRLNRTRTMHGFALNVDCDLEWFGRIVPCGIPDKAVTSLTAEGRRATMQDVVDAVAARAADRWGAGGADRADVAWRRRPEELSPFSRGLGPGEVPGRPVRLQSRMDEAGLTDGLAINGRKPEWMRVPLRTGPEFRRLRSVLHSRDLVTVCEEAGCPNIYECWNEGTATFMINGERCTRACGFCLVDTRRPEPLDPAEPERVADAVEAMGLDYAVITAVARDDLPDGGAAGFAAAAAAIRQRSPDVRVEVLIPDCKGDPEALAVIFGAEPDVLNHNIETVARLQRVVRPSAGYARSLAVLARAKAAGLTTKSSIIVGMGETDDEVAQTMADLAAVGADIVTVGQYLRPTTHHLPVARWVPPDQFEQFQAIGQSLGIAHVEASPLTRSSHHAQHAHAQAVSASVGVGVGAGAVGPSVGAGAGTQAASASVGVGVGTGG